MLTEEQLLKAKIALAQKNNEDPEKVIALECHKKAKKSFEEYGLPYRVYFDYLMKRFHEDTDTVPINPCYPLPGYPIDEVIRITKNDFNTSGKNDSYTYENLNDEKKSAVLMLIAKYKNWNKFEYDGRWAHLFAMFMVGYDFKSFTDFDFIGTTGELRPEEVSLCRDCFTDAIMGTFAENKDNGKYMLQEPESRPEDKYLYSDKPFMIILEKGEIRDAVAIEKEMNIPPDERLRKLYMDQYGIDIYD